MERDKFLTEAMGLRHECEKRENDIYYCYCGKPWGNPGCVRMSVGWCIDFSTWEGFGKLWEWAQGQEWWGNFWVMNSWGQGYCDPSTGVPYQIHLINPDRFSEAVYLWLKEKK